MAFHRLGSTTSHVLDAMVDIFELVSVDGTRYDRLYLDMYHLGQSQKAPEGYRLIGELTGITGTSIGSSLTPAAHRAGRLRVRLLHLWCTGRIVDAQGHGSREGARFSQSYVSAK